MRAAPHSLNKSQERAEACSGLLLLTCSWVTGISLCLASSLITPRSVLMSNLQPTSTTLAPGQNSCVSACHCGGEITRTSINDDLCTCTWASETEQTLFVPSQRRSDCRGVQQRLSIRTSCAWPARWNRIEMLFKWHLYGCQHPLARAVWMPRAVGGRDTRLNVDLQSAFKQVCF